MSKSIKLNDNTYLDSSGVTHNRECLSNILNELTTTVDIQLAALTNCSVGNYYRGVKNLSSYIPSGYRLIGITPTYISYGDRNFLQYNLYYDNNSLYWQMYCQWAGDGKITVNIRLFLIKVL